MELHDDWISVVVLFMDTESMVAFGRTCRKYSLLLSHEAWDSRFASTVGTRVAVCRNYNTRYLHKEAGIIKAEMIEACAYLYLFQCGSCRYRFHDKTTIFSDKKYIDISSLQGGFLLAHQEGIEVYRTGNCGVEYHVRTISCCGVRSVVATTIDFVIVHKSDDTVALITDEETKIESDVTNLYCFNDLKYPNYACVRKGESVKKILRGDQTPGRLHESLYIKHSGQVFCADIDQCLCLESERKGYLSTLSLSNVVDAMYWRDWGPVFLMDNGCLLGIHEQKSHVLDRNVVSVSSSRTVDFLCYVRRM